MTTAQTYITAAQDAEARGDHVKARKHWRAALALIALQIKKLT